MKKLERWDKRRVPRIYDVISERVVGLEYRREIAVGRNLSYVLSWKDIVRLG